MLKHGDGFLDSSKGVWYYVKRINGKYKWFNLGLKGIKANERAAEKAAKEAAERASLDAIEMAAKLKNAGKVGLVVSGVAVSVYGVYKAVPKVKQWWNERKQTDERIEPVVEINNEGEEE